MPVLAYDRPPMSTAAIVAKMNDTGIRHGCDLPLTASLSSGGVRVRASKHRTNATRDFSIGTARVMSMCTSALAELDRYGTFVKGWDGYDGEPIAPAALDLAVTLTRAIALTGNHRVTDIIPGPASDGSLDLEIRAGARSLIITMHEDAPSEVLELRTFRSDGEVTEEKADIDTNALVRDLRWIMA